MITTARLNRLQARVSALYGPDPPSFAEFVEKWEHMDQLSKSLYEAAMSVPELVGTPRHWPTIQDYLRRMGIDPEENP